MTISRNTPAGQFCQYLICASYPAPLRRKIRLHLLDALACGWAASGHRVSEPMIRASRLFGGNGHCSVFGESGFSPLAAAFANAAMR
ncbi:MmgE/PrpD family protein [Klebsiella variicola subsp. variicola]|nr:MmgE/PrpD family protein [Klebsiella variicola subsp. variicola]